ncbi:MAG: hypothetical protein COA93_10355 [Alphaproteobacteria bacterium]|nr:MAG: hypothetical protein COA93_10355 [Alphaproteobacteria bacterium]
MLFIKNKILVVMLMLMVFIGQTANATNASCQMDISQNIHLDMDTTNRSAKDMINHIIIIDTATQSFMDDCCIQDCDCALGGGVHQLYYCLPLIKTGKWLPFNERATTRIW